MSDEQTFASLCELRALSSNLVPGGTTQPGVFTFIVEQKDWLKATRCVESIVVDLRVDDLAIDVNFSSSNLGFKLYESPDTFLWRVSTAEIDSHVGALPTDSDSGFLLLGEQNIVCSSSDDDTTVKSVENLVSFIRLIDFLKSEVADYYDSTLSEIVFVSPISGAVKMSTKGRQFAFQSRNPDFHKSAQRLMSEVRKHGAHQFLKYELARILYDLRQDTRLTHFLTNLDAFTERSLRQSEIASAGNKLDNLLSEFRTKIEAYFASVQAVINRVGATIISIPVTLGSSVFATLKIESTLVTIASTIVYVMYSAFAILYQAMAWHDLSELKTQLKSDESRLKVVAPLSAADFLYREGSVLRRILMTRIWIVGVVVLLVAFAVGVVYLASMDLALPPEPATDSTLAAVIPPGS